MPNSGMDRVVAVKAPLGMGWKWKTVNKDGAEVLSSHLIFLTRQGALENADNTLSGRYRGFFEFPSPRVETTSDSEE